jgi:hypothetical protein
MEYRVLGPLEVLAGDRVVPTGGVRRLSLLALLLINANEVVSAERPIDQLWGESPPGHGREEPAGDGVGAAQGAARAQGSRRHGALIRHGVQLATAQTARPGSSCPPSVANGTNASMSRALSTCRSSSGSPRTSIANGPPTSMTHCS